LKVAKSASERAAIPTPSSLRGDEEWIGGSFVVLGFRFVVVMINESPERVLERFSNR
jgi:hypothetical protein